MWFLPDKTVGFYHSLKIKKDQTFKMKVLKNEMVPQNKAVKSRMLFHRTRNPL